MATSRDGFSLVIPAYNEAAGIRQAIVEADEALRQPWSALRDRACGRRQPGRHVGRGRRERGQPAARLACCAIPAIAAMALRCAPASRPRADDLVGFTDADCQFHLADLTGLLARAEGFPIVVGYRVGRQDPARRRFLSWGYNTLVRILLGTGVRDCDCALKVFHRDALTQLLPESSNFFVNTEMLARARRLRLPVAEVGVRHRPRRHGQSKVSLAEVPKMLRTLLPFWWTHAVMRRSARRSRCRHCRRCTPMRCERRIEKQNPATFSRGFAFGSSARNDPYSRPAGSRPHPSRFATFVAEMWRINFR